jgi:multimeric flavodoxin WrbA
MRILTTDNALKRCTGCACCKHWGQHGFRCIYGNESSGKVGYPRIEEVVTCPVGRDRPRGEGLDW